MHAPHRGRRLILPSFMILALAAITCRSTAYFNLDHEGTVSLQAGANTGAEPWALAGLNSINLTAHPLMRTQGLNVTDVTQATLQKILLAVDAPETGADMAFLSQVDVVLTADAMQPLTIASGTSFPVNVPMVALDLAAAQVTGYLKGKNPTITVVPTFETPAPAGTTLSLRVLTQVRVGQPGGSCQN